jgi:hypothetical protein|tara:strand:- start:2401 stop:2592 length:192 start_codon:yes stop_codon:yes gene_type:complete
LIERARKKINFLSSRIKPKACHYGEHKKRKCEDALPIRQVSEERHEKEKCRDVAKSHKGKASD